MLNWGGSSGVLLVSRVYSRAVDIYLQFSVYVMFCFLFFFIHFLLFTGVAIWMVLNTYR